MSALAWLLLAVAAGPEDDFLRTAGGVEARLSLDVPDEGVGPGLARVRIEVVVSGPVGMRVEGPRLEDALAAWGVVQRSTKEGEAGGKSVTTLSLTLEQVKPGVVALPGVVLRVRRGAI